jgi:UDPglucose 6-dehydrogenase/GDP-mannose 6-dehydrogenase
MRLTIVGAGYVGLVSGVCFAEKGHHVSCVDTNVELVARLNAGRPHIYERGLEDLLQRGLKSGRFVATTDLANALGASDVVIIAVGTSAEGGDIDLQFVLAAARRIGEYLRAERRYLSVIVKSTVVPGTTDTLVRSEIAKASGVDLPSFGLGMNPEFLREGDGIGDFMDPDRIVLGYEDEQTRVLLEMLYEPWPADKLHVNTRTAELIKCASNALLAIQMSSINELANLAAAVGGIDIMDVVAGIRADERWNPRNSNGRASPGILDYLVPGCGFGGSCLPKDARALCALGRQKGATMHVLDAVLKVNDVQPYQVERTLERAMGALPGRTILVLGLAFKPETDDVRESTSIKIVQSLIERGARVLAHDPIARDNFRKAIGPGVDSVTMVDNWKESVDAAEVIIVATRWPEYRQVVELDLTGKTVFDARRLLHHRDVTTGRYLTIGCAVDSEY